MFAGLSKIVKIQPRYTARNTATNGWEADFSATHQLASALRIIHAGNGPGLCISLQRAKVLTWWQQVSPAWPRNGWYCSSTPACKERVLLDRSGVCRYRWSSSPQDPKNKNIFFSCDVCPFKHSKSASLRLMLLNFGRKCKRKNLVLHTRSYETIAAQSVTSFLLNSKSSAFLRLKFSCVSLALCFSLRRIRSKLSYVHCVINLRMCLQFSVPVFLCGIASHV